MKRQEKYYKSILEILNIIADWKLIGSKDLFQLISSGDTYRTLKKKILELEKLNLISSIDIGNRHKHLYLTEKGYKLTLSNHKLAPNSEFDICTHLALVKILMGTIHYTRLEKIKLTHDYNEKDVLSHAELTLMHKDKTYKIAVLVELLGRGNQKVSV